MTIAEQKAALERYQGMTEMPDDFETVWRGHWIQTDPAENIEVERLPFHNTAAVYENWTIPVSGGGDVQARYIRPAGDGPFPTVLMFHDLGRAVRGWHHMTRFVALGYAVAALENGISVTNWRKDWQDLNLKDRYLNVLTLAHVILGYPKTDPQRLMAWGEGFGGGLAVVAGSLVPGMIRCAALNPLPGDLGAMCAEVGETDQMALDHLDPVNFASLLTCPLLLGTGLLDQTAPAGIQYAMFNRAHGPKTHLVYPKYEHERINFYENELLRFFHI